MYLNELIEGEKVTLLANINGETLTFDTTINQVSPGKNLVLVNVVFVDGKIVTFRGANLTIDLVVSPISDTPQIFKNVAITLVKKFDGTLTYSISSIASSKNYNRRDSYRCFVGVSTSVQKKLNAIPYDAVIKDVSAGGFSLVVPQDLKFENNQVIHVVLDDYLDELSEKFTFHLYGLVVRSEDLEKNRVLYGCKFNQKVNGIENYIMKKERIRLKKNSGKS
ncbi:MAG: PilZ domain-containing protein [Lachnospiraceae bacterium]|nr:PilZ domain-containing protein [Lachnospiraceae bacterium]